MTGEMTEKLLRMRVLLGVLCALSAAPAAAQDDDVTPPEDVYFDFAMHDEAHIFTRGSWPKDEKKAQEARQHAGELYAVLDDENAEAPSENAAQGLSEETREETQSVFDAPKGKKFRVSDLVLNCDIEFCKKKENVDALLRATGLSLGRIATSEELSLAKERLRKTGYFSHIQQKFQYSGDRVSVTFDVVGHVVIHKVSFDITRALFESDLKKRMMLHASGMLYPRTALLRGRDVDEMSREELTQIAIDDQIKSLKRLYTKDGYLSTDVRIDITPVNGDPNLVDLTVVVENAKGYRLGKVYVKGHALKSYSDIESTFRSGFSFFGNVTKEQIEDSVSDVLDLYRNEGYFQTRIDFVSRQNDEMGSIDVFLKITEGAKWIVEYRGNSALNAKELDEALTFKSSGYVDNAEVSASAESLKKLYISAGYYWAEVHGEMIKGGDNRPSAIIMTIKEGPRTEIGEIVFDGANLPREELLGMISSTEYAAFGGGAYPQRSMIADDAAKLVDGYRERGYLNADVPSWTLEPITKDGRLRLTFQVQEGERSRLTHRQIRFTDKAQYEKFDVYIDEPETDAYSDEALRTERAAITKQLRSRGYASITDRLRCTSYNLDGSLSSLETCDIAELPGACMPSEPEELCTVEETENGRVERCDRHYATQNGDPTQPECRLQDGLTGQLIDVEYEITLGPQYTFGDVFVHGNVATRDWVVRQDIPFERGETFDYNLIMDARSLLRQRSIYSSATLNVIGVEDDLVAKTENADSTGTTEHPVPVVVNLEEGRRRWFDFALGLSLTGSDWILTGEAEYVEANLLGLGWQLSVLLMPEARFLNGSEWVFVQKFNQNFFALMTLTVPLLPSEGLDLVGQLFYDLRYIPETNKEEAGGLVEVQWNVNTSWFAALAFEAKSSVTSSFSIDVSDDLDDYHVCYPITFFQDCPFSSNNRAVTFSLTPRAIYDGRDSPLSPKYGFYAEGKLKLAYSSSVGVYFKPDVRVSYIYTFLKNFTLGLNLHVGLSFLKDSSVLPLIDRFFLGGLSMRGYDTDALGPRLVNSLSPSSATNEAAGGEALFNLNAELRFPIWNSVGIFAAVFIDAGSIVAHQPTHYDGAGFFKEMFVNEMRYTAGLGLRWMISDSIPPIVIDYGFILNRRHGDPLGAFSLNIGYTF